MTTDFSQASAAVLPTAGQLEWQRDAMGVFFHFGINTFHGKEWSDGTLPAASFNPTELDAHQWVSAARRAGARYVILTAKHHDGFCLWPSALTTYSVASSPWKDGHGDVVAEVAAACRAAGMKFGLYLSPWDRNADVYPDRLAYDEFYLGQLRELCTHYGELSELWFDGAGSEGRTYDWERISALIAELQPEAMVFNMGRPSIRWVGNEHGLASDPVNYVVNRTEFSNYTTVTTTLDENLYLPPECDVSIRRGWFWHPEEAPKDQDHLLAIYYRSIGLGANLLLNLPPNTQGLIPEEDVSSVTEFGQEIERRFGSPIPARLAEIESQEPGVSRWRVDFERAQNLDHLRLREDLGKGQGVRHHRILLEDQLEDSVVVLAEGQTVGIQRIHAFPAIQAKTLVIELEGEEPQLVGVQGFHTGTPMVPDIPYLASTDYPEEYMDL